MNDGTGPVEERFYPRIWRRAIATGLVTQIDGAEALKRLPAGQDLWMRVDGRTPKPAAQKLNPLWWAVNDWDKLPPDWSLPGKPEWLRAFNWWWRNPFHNGGRYVLGVGDRNYWVHITRRDGYKALTNSEGFSYQDLYGWEIGEIILNDGAALPWFAYGSDTAVFYAGWQPTGFAGIKFNRRALWFSPTLPLLFLAMIGSRALAALCPPKREVPDLPTAGMWVDRGCS